MLENKHLNSFLRVMDLGSFSKASQTLNVAQPALSQHVKKLEQALGAQLLNRHAHGVSPTAAGREFSTQAREILALVNHAEKRFQSSESELFGEIRLGFPGSVCPVLAPALIIKAAEVLPNVKLIVTEQMSGDLTEMLMAGRLDAAVLFNIESTADFSAEPLAIERLSLIGAHDAPLVKESTVHSSMLPDLPLVGTFPPHGLRLLLDKWASEIDVSLQFKIEADAPSVLIRLAASGYCYSIVSKAAINHEILLGEIGAAEIVDPPIERTAYICTTKRLPPDDARNAIVSLIKNTVKDVMENDLWPGATL